MRQGGGFIGGDTPALIAARLPDLVLEIGALRLARVSFGGAVFLPKGAKFHLGNLLQLLQDLLAFMGIMIHADKDVYPLDIFQVKTIANPHFSQF